MDSKEIHIYDNIDGLATGLGNFINQLLSKNRKINIALSGGSTPARIYDYWTSHMIDKINWNDMQYFSVDERCVPSDHMDSNYKMTFDKLFRPANIRESHIHRIIGESEPIKETLRYSNLIRNNVRSIRNTPVFDLMILGIGEDGHTASIFPDQLHLLGSDKICEVATHPDTNQKRITLTGNVINNASNIVFLVTGRYKSAIVRELLNQVDGDWLDYPAAFIQPVKGKLTWFLDRSAASLLKRR